MFDHESTAVTEAARSLLGCRFTGYGVTVIITEVEAYGGACDPASHAYTRTPRSQMMYEQPWKLYVYRSYGVHWCANIVTGPTSIAGAVLLRAGRVISGYDRARRRRGNVPDQKLACGPGNFGKALAITGADAGTDVRAAGDVQLSQAPEAAHDISSGPRVGVSKAADVPWRFWLTDESSVSAYRRSPRANR